MNTTKGVVDTYFSKEPKRGRLSEKSEAEVLAEEHDRMASRLVQVVHEVEALSAGELVACVVDAMVKHVALLGPIWVSQTQLSPHPPPETRLTCGHAEQYARRLACEWLDDSLERVGMTPWLLLPDSMNEDGMRTCRPLLHLYSHTASSLLPHLRVEVAQLPLRARTAVKQMLVAGAWRSNRVLMPMRAYCLYNHTEQDRWAHLLRTALVPALRAWLRAHRPPWPPCLPQVEKELAQGEASPEGSE